MNTAEASEHGTPSQADAPFAGADNAPAHAHESPQPHRTRHRPAVNRWHIEPVLEAQEESWLMTYLDVITLLLVMMVVMLSLAGPPNRQTTADTGNTPPDPAAAAPAPTQVSADIVPPVPLPVAVPAQDPLAGLPLDALGQGIEVLKDDNALRFRISSEMLFSSGASQLAPGGISVLESLLPVLNAQPTWRLVVEGHTDDVPIQTERFPSNWELSTGRAASVARYLIERGIAPQRLQANGYADTRPIGSAQRPSEKALNRRLELTMEMPAPTGRGAR